MTDGSGILKEKYDHMKFVLPGQAVSLVSFMLPRPDARSMFYAYAFEQFVKNCPDIMAKIIEKGRPDYNKYCIEHTIERTKTVFEKTRKIQDTRDQKLKELKDRYGAFRATRKEVMEEKVRCGKATEEEILNDLKIEDANHENALNIINYNAEQEIHGMQYGQFSEHYTDLDNTFRFNFIREADYIWVMFDNFLKTNYQKINEDFHEKFQRDQHSLIKVWGCFKTQTEAKEYAKKLKKHDVPGTALITNSCAWTIFGDLSLDKNTEFSDDTLDKAVRAREEEYKNTQLMLQHRVEVSREMTARNTKKYTGKDPDMEARSTGEKKERIPRSMEKVPEEEIRKQFEFINPKDVSNLKMKGPMPGQTNSLDVFSEFIESTIEAGKGAILDEGILKKCGYTEEQIKKIRSVPVEQGLIPVKEMPKIEARPVPNPFRDLMGKPVPKDGGGKCECKEGKEGEGEGKGECKGESKEDK